MYGYFTVSQFCQLLREIEALPKLKDNVKINFWKKLIIKNFRENEKYYAFH